ADRRPREDRLRLETDPHRRVAPRRTPRVRRGLNRHNLESSYPQRQPVPAARRSRGVVGRTLTLAAHCKSDRRDSNEPSIDQCSLTQIPSILQDSFRTQAASTFYIPEEIAPQPLADRTGQRC